MLKILSSQLVVGNLTVVLFTTVFAFALDCNMLKGYYKHKLVRFTGVPLKC